MVPLGLSLSPQVPCWSVKPTQAKRKVKIKPLFTYGNGTARGWNGSASSWFHSLLQKRHSRGCHLLGRGCRAADGPQTRGSCFLDLAGLGGRGGEEKYYMGSQSAEIRPRPRAPPQRKWPPDGDALARSKLCPKHGQSPYCSRPETTVPSLGTEPGVWRAFPQGPARKASTLACGQMKGPTCDPVLEPPLQPGEEGRTEPWVPRPASSQAPSRGSKPSGLGWGEGQCLPFPLSGAARTWHSLDPWSPGPPGDLGEACTAPTCGCGPGCGRDHLREPRPGGVSIVPAPWIRNRGSPRDEVTLLVHGTPVCVRVEKAVDRLKPGKGTGWSVLPGVGVWVATEPLPTAHSPSGILLQAEASCHIHHVTWVLRTPVAQGDLDEGRGQVTVPGRALPAPGVQPGAAALPWLPGPPRAGSRTARRGDCAER